jgi:CPA1 family monovalent cation:H+ antiporter
MVSQILIVMIAALAVTIFAERRNIQPPLLLALVGLAASWLPGLTRLELEPEIILAVVLPPLLYSAATEFSFISFLRRLGSIVNLGVILVVVTTSVVGAIAAATIPGLPIAAATVLAAVISPPDAVTATAIGRKLGLPGRMMTVLKGESLINDAAALTLFTFAVATVTGAHLFIEGQFLFFIYSAFVGTLVGIVIGFVVNRMRGRLTNPSVITLLSVLVPFTAYMIAEELSASGVLAVVAAGFAVGHNSSEAGFAARIQERQFWRTTDALLEAFVFAYIGLQLRFVIEDAEQAGYEFGQILLMSAVMLVAVTVVRFAWVFGTALVSRWRGAAAQRRLDELKQDPKWRERLAEQGRRHGARRGGNRPARPEDFEVPEPFSWRENLIIAWTGMRGVVTLAAAAGIPLTTMAGEAFPGRDIIQATAFMVTIGTLLIQGLTLPWLIKALGISDPREASYRGEQHKLANRIGEAATKEAVSAYRETHPDPEVQKATELMLRRMGSADKAGEDARGPAGPLMLELGGIMLEARRAALIKARDDRQLDDEVLREELEELDLQQAVLANWTVRGERN